MPDPRPRRPFDLMPVIVLAVLVCLMLGGYFLFPLIQGVVAHQDCVASGRTDCLPH